MIYRRAREGDQLRVAELTHMASHGVVEYLFRDLMPGLSAVQCLAQLKTMEGPYHYGQALVAEYGGQVVGMAAGMSAEHVGVTEAMRGFFPADRLEHCHDLLSAKVEGSYYLDALGVLPEFRNRGIGGELVQRVMREGLEKGFTEMSLTALAGNTGALRFYERHGLTVVRPVRLEPNEFITHTGGAVLLSGRLKEADA